MGHKGLENTFLCQRKVTFLSLSVQFTLFTLAKSANLFIHVVYFFYFSMQISVCVGQFESMGYGLINAINFLLKLSIRAVLFTILTR